MPTSSHNTTRRSCVFAAVAALGLAACTSQPTRDETQAQVDAAQATLANFVRDPDMTWFREHVGSAKAVLISPKSCRPVSSSASSAVEGGE